MLKLVKKIINWCVGKIRLFLKASASALRLKRIQDKLGHTFRLDQRLVFSLHERHLPSLRQFKYLPRLLNKLERKLLFVLAAVFIFSTGFLAFRFYLAHRVFVPADGGEYIESLVGAPHNINPLYARANPVDDDMVSLIYSSLLRYDGHGKLVLDLAESFEVSEDFKNYKLALRRDARFHDGVPVTADDVLFTFSAIQDSAWKSSLSMSFAGVSVEKVDDYTIKFKLGEPFAPFLSSLTFGILPKHLWQNIDPASARLSELNSKPVGSGPFKFHSFTRAKDGSYRSYAVERNDSFYGKKPYLDRVIFYFYPDEESAMAALRDHTVLGMSRVMIGESAQPGLSKDRMEINTVPGNEVDKNPEIEYYKLKLPQYTALFFNVRKNSILADQKVRRVLALALNRERILKEGIKSEGDLADTPILDGFIGFNKNIKPVLFDSQAAADMLDDLGWKISPTGTIREKKQEKLSIILKTLDNPEYSRVASIVAENWKSIGVETIVETVAGADLQRDAIRPRNYDVLLYGEILGIEPDLYPFWHSSQADDPGLNLSGFINRDADKLLEEARVFGNVEDRASRYRAFQEILAGELPAIFLYSPNYIYPQRKTVRGFNVELLAVPSDRFANIEDWYIKMKRVFK